MSIKETIGKWLWAIRYKKAVKKANKLRRQHGMKYQVYVVKGKPRAIAKQNLTRLVKNHYFGKGIKMADIEKRCLYSTI